MVVFSTMFYVKKSLTMERMTELAFEWANGSPHYGFGNIAWNGGDSGEYISDDGKQKFSVIVSNDGNILAMRMENTDENNILWINDFVYESGEERNVLSVRLTRDADRESFIPDRFNRPRLMKTVLREGYGDVDNDMEISDRVINITEKNIDIAENIICGNVKYIMPVVYVTRRYSDGRPCLDANELARDLAGVAHVLVESGKNITSVLSSRTGRKNPFDGAVQIYYTDKNSVRIMPENVSRKRIVDSVCRRLALLKVDDRYTWSDIKYRKLYDKYYKDKENSSELIEFYKEMNDEYDRDNRSKQQDIDYLQSELDEALDEINRLKSRVSVYEHSFNSRRNEYTDDGNAVTVSIACGEEEFYESEIKDLLLKLVADEKSKMDGDPNQRGWRRYHVLDSIVENNEILGKGKELEDELKRILSRTDGLSGKDKRRLNELGFVSRGENHDKLYFHDDGRYMITVAKTPSDSRTADNLAATVVNKIIC